MLRISGKRATRCDRGQGKEVPALHSMTSSRKKGCGTEGPAPCFRLMTSSRAVWLRELRFCMPDAQSASSLPCFLQTISTPSLMGMDVPSAISYTPLSTERAIPKSPLTFVIAYELERVPMPLGAYGTQYELSLALDLSRRMAVGKLVGA